ncbi:hypothetical protein Cgig2_017832 [Carnegiea gigantea]|uniref:Uncharacterized protein n=1 Tax=Carnegiea gigantea TaxID=171969 RepID=A0A9Q1QRY8_9CARY|nr:hypothetical protein Cgig2_017832 [Carnegiea gigantea]
MTRLVACACEAVICIVGFLPLCLSRTSKLPRHFRHHSYRHGHHSASTQSKSPPSVLAGRIRHTVAAAALRPRHSTPGRKGKGTNPNTSRILAKQASSPADVVGTLVEFGLSSSGETRAFAKEIARVPRKSGGVNSEEEQFRDQREREELERHIRKWDAARTQKLTEPKMSKEEEGMLDKRPSCAHKEAIRRSNALEKDDLEALRKVSRQEYLKKREKKKLEELRDEIEDEQYLFEGVELTEAECRELRYKKEIYELVTKRWTEDAGEISEVVEMKESFGCLHDHTSSHLTAKM